MRKARNDEVIATVKAPMTLEAMAFPKLSYFGTLTRCKGWAERVNLMHGTTEHAMDAGSYKQHRKNSRMLELKEMALDRMNWRMTHEVARGHS